MRRINKPVVAIAAAALVLGTAGVAFAYWTTTGSGEGAGSTTEGVVDTLAFDQNTLTAMYPGDSPQDLVVEVKNAGPNEAVYVSSVKAYITTAPGDPLADPAPVCDGSNFLLGGVAAPSTEATAAALLWTAQDLAVDEAHDATGTVQFNNKLTNQDACKGAVVTVHYVAN